MISTSVFINYKFNINLKVNELAIDLFTIENYIGELSITKNQKIDEIE